jgi:hypothetical protein
MFIGSSCVASIGTEADPGGLTRQRHMMSIRPKVPPYGILLSVIPMLRKNSIDDPSWYFSNKSTGRRGSRMKLLRSPRGGRSLSSVLSIWTAHH